MRSSGLKHTLAVLRTTIDEKQDGFASLIGKTVSTVASIESGRLPLSEELAEHIAAETGVNLSWLLANKTKKPIVAWDGKPYTLEKYKKYRAALRSDEGLQRDEVGHAVEKFLNQFFCALLFATVWGKHRILMERLTRALAEIEFDIAKWTSEEGKRGKLNIKESEIQPVAFSTMKSFVAVLDRMLKANRKAQRKHKRQ